MKNKTKPTDFNNQQITNLDDIHLVAYLSMCGYRIVPWKSDEGPIVRISFDIVGNPLRITEDIQGFYDNDKVGVQDFIRNLKEVKNQMYQMKRIGQERGSN